MTEARFNLRKNVLHQAFSFAVSLALTFLTYRILIERSGIEAVGTWSLLLAWTSLIRLGDLGLATATLRFVARHDLDHEQEVIRDTIETGILSNSAIFGLLNLLGWLILTWALPYLVSADHLAEGEALLPWLFLLSFLSNLSWIVLGSLQGLHAGYVAARLSVAGNILQLLLALLLIPAFSLLGLAWAQIAMHLALAIVGWLLLHHWVPSAGWVPYHFNRERFREMLGYSLRAQVASTLSNFFEPATKLLVSLFGDAALQGIYELAYKTVMLPRSVVMASIQASMPAFSYQTKTDPEASRALYRRILRRTAQVTVAVGVAICLGAPVASWLWLGHVDLRYWAFTVILTLGILTALLNAPGASIGFVTGNLRHNIWTALATLALTFALGFVIGQIFGPYGTVAAISAGTGLGSIILRRMNERFLHQQAPT
ncbi:hypothetical protein CDV50_10965 [Haematobacter massiliensis]|uniref:Uncharacterized protein n=1 Tax=Haematobacter massiliensis TaxID=195105 RepID=A0A086XYC3_9RHOB|nr:oligosaccharide flippase family protein [Haematobacter massiliensis]KFI27023.1 hypothetical protein CN97_02185 [Haematobacter massiliensis]OWJ71021.1 hypothetical protein CDV50_10965 [Haematobacter massiliensis]OWJ88392.1 hypothetical protein CDV51_01755 [Haematobacter massiliensis]QBJ22833.1 hypothetical protein HmaOT1_00315 [Haematobacter massiliensis]